MKKPIFILTLFCACCVNKPVLITRHECNEKAIDAHIQECIPAKTADQKEWKYYYDECLKQAKAKFCREMKFLIIKGKQVPCDEVEEKYKEFCK